MSDAAPPLLVVAVFDLCLDLRFQVPDPATMGLLRSSQGEIPHWLAGAGSGNSANVVPSLEALPLRPSLSTRGTLGLILQI